MEHKGLLSGMKVLDLSRVLAAPYCGMMLADLGAEVIKIERPGKGDDARSNFPIVNGESAYYMNLNRNKRGIVLNLKSQKRQLPPQIVLVESLHQHFLSYSPPHLLM